MEGKIGGNNRKVSKMKVAANNYSRGKRRGE